MAEDKKTSVDIDKKDSTKNKKNITQKFGKVRSYVRFGKGVLSSVMLILFIILFYRTLQGNISEPFTFSGFLNTLANVPDVSLSWVSGWPDLTITADWGVFDFLRVFINSIGDSFEIIIYFIGGVLQLIFFIVYILTYVLGGVIAV